MEPEAPQQGPIGRILAILFLVLFLLTALLILGSFPAGVYAFFSGKLSANLSASTTGYPYLWVGPLPVVLPFATSYGTAFLAVTVVYLLMFAFAVRQGASLRAAVDSGLRQGFGGFLTNKFVVVVVAIAFIEFTATTLDRIVEALGGTIGNALGGADTLQVMTSLTLTPLREEFGFRALVVGLVAVILVVGRPGRSALRAFWRPSAAYEGLAVGSATFVIIWAATGGSAVVFGLCHVTSLCGGGWDLGKLPEATYGGVVLGYLYVRYGFHVAVLTHWGVDYFGFAYSWFGQAFAGIPWNSASGEYWLQALVDLDMLMWFGIASFLVVSYLWVMRLRRKQAQEPAGPLGSS